MGKSGNLFNELKRRNVFRVGAAYAVVGWLTIEVVDTLAPRMAMPEWVPGLVIILMLIGLPIALLFAWAFELTPEGVQKSKDVDVEVSVTAGTDRKLDRMIIAGLALGMVFLLADRFRGGPGEMGEPVAGAAPPAEETQASEVSIAVLPFVNMSSDPEQEYFSDGISEELLNVLTKVEGLKVAARTSSFSFKGQNKPVGEIAEVLGVGHILEGSVRKSGTQIRITAQLIRVSDGFHMWSDTYDRELVNIFAIQDEIAEAIVSELRVRLTGQTKIASTSTRNTEAYQAYLKGRYFWNLRSGPDILTAVEHFETATGLDPEFAEAWAGLADVFVVLPAYDPDHQKALPRYEQARQAAKRALAIDPTMGRAYATLGTASTAVFRWQEALDYFEKGQELDPDYATGWQWYGTTLAEMGRKDEGLEALERALELDPVSRIINNNYAGTLRGAGRTAEAVKHFKYAISLDPGFAFHRYGLGQAHLEAGRFPEARAAFREYARLAGEDSEIYLAWIDRIENYSTTGQVDDISPELLDIPTLNLRDWAAFHILSGHIDAGLDFLDEAADAGYMDAGLYWTLSDYCFRSVWDHPRFIALRARLGVPKAPAN